MCATMRRSRGSCGQVFTAAVYTAVTLLQWSHAAATTMFQPPARKWPRAATSRGSLRASLPWRGEIAACSDRAKPRLSVWCLVSWRFVEK